MKGTLRTGWSLHQIRYNLFHGAKDIKNPRDVALVRCGAEFLRTSIDYWINGD
jgi:hypothetical protein